MLILLSLLIYTCSDDDPAGPVSGCMDDTACNYNESATVDDDSCEFPVDSITNCDGTCGGVDLATVDCAGVCDGTSVLDECNLCDGDNSTCADCAGTPNGTAELDCADVCDGLSTLDDCGDCWTPYCYYGMGSFQYEDQDTCDTNGGTWIGTGGNPSDPFWNQAQDVCGVCNGSGIADGACDCDGNVLDCAGMCGGMSVVDECGVCEGPGIADGACDCDGNVLDECGVCNGSGIADGACDCDGNVVDECGVCNGPGIADGACDCDGTLPTENFDCDGNCTATVDECGVCGGDGSSCAGDDGGDDGGAVISDGCELPENTLYVLSTGDVIYNIPTDIAGFQFNVDGTTASGASGGLAGEAGFTVSAGGTTVLAFSFTGATVSNDCGLLTTLATAGEVTGLSGIVFSDSTAGTIEVNYYDDSTSGR